MGRIVRLEPLVKRHVPALGEVDELIEDHQITPMNLLAQRTHGRGGENGGTAQGLEGMDVGPVVDMRGRGRVSATVTGQKDHVLAADLALTQRGIGRAVGRIQFQIAWVVQDVGIVQAAAANDADTHACSLLRRKRSVGRHLGDLQNALAAVRTQLFLPV